MKSHAASLKESQSRREGTVEADSVPSWWPTVERAWDMNVPGSVLICCHSVLTPLGSRGDEFGLTDKHAISKQ